MLKEPKNRCDFKNIICDVYPLSTFIFNCNCIHHRHSVMYQSALSGSKEFGSILSVYPLICTKCTNIFPRHPPTTVCNCIVIVIDTLYFPHNYGIHGPVHNDLILFHHIFLEYLFFVYNKHKLFYMFSHNSITLYTPYVLWSIYRKA